MLFQIPREESCGLLNGNEDWIFRCPVMGVLGTEPDFFIGIVLQRELVKEVICNPFFIGIAKGRAPHMDFIFRSVGIVEGVPEQLIHGFPFLPISAELHDPAVSGFPGGIKCSAFRQFPGFPGDQIDVGSLHVLAQPLCPGKPASNAWHRRNRCCLPGRRSWWGSSQSRWR